MSNSFDPVGYWEGRHAELVGDLRSVGNKGLSSEQNAELISCKAVRVASQLARLGVSSDGLLLDAGCGAGAFTNLLIHAGYNMMGVDCSSTAIEVAAKNCRGSFFCSTLSGFNIPVRFDAVLCLDVLFHIVDEEEWKTSLSNLIGHIKPGGYLLIIEYFADYGKKTAAHVVWRNFDKYIALFDELGICLQAVNKFHYPHEGKEKTLMAVKVSG